MSSYTNEYSKLPQEILTLHHYKDVDDTVAPLVNQVKELQAQGKYNKVNEIIKSRPELNLQQYVFSAEDWNALEEETRNLEIMAKSKSQQIYYQTEEPDGGDCNVWIG